MHFICGPSSATGRRRNWFCRLCSADGGSPLRLVWARSGIELAGSSTRFIPRRADCSTRMYTRWVWSAAFTNGGRGWCWSVAWNSPWPHRAERTYRDNTAIWQASLTGRRIRLAPRWSGRRANMLRRLLIVVGSLVVVAALAVSWLGVAQVPVLSAAFGMDTPRDLQMVQDRAGFNDFCAKWGLERPSPAANYTLSSKHHWSGSVAVDDTISEAAIASLREFNTSNARFSQIQFRVHEGFVAMSAFVNVPGYPVSGPM